jgi:hypothetical protein
MRWGNKPFESEEPLGLGSWSLMVISHGDE